MASSINCIFFRLSSPSAYGDTSRAAQRRRSDTEQGTESTFVRHSRKKLSLSVDIICSGDLECTTQGILGVKHAGFLAPVTAW